MWKCIIIEIELVNPASFVLLRNLRLFEAGTSLCCGKQWVMIIVAYREEIQLYCFSTATCLQEPLSSGRAALDSVFFCVQITRFVCIFSIFLLCYALSQPSLRPMLSRKPSSVFCCLQLGFITRLLPHPFTSNKHTGYVYQNRVK